MIAASLLTARRLQPAQVVVACRGHRIAGVPLLERFPAAFSKLACLLHSACVSVQPCGGETARCPADWQSGEPARERRAAWHPCGACLAAAPRAGLSARRAGAQLNLTPGRKGLRAALGHVPSWVAFTDREKVEVRSDRVG
jgi:hypothetical protein